MKWFILVSSFAMITFCYGQEVVDVAIIGCGVSGTYCAAKISEKYPEKRVVLYDALDRIGGRLFSVRFPDMPHVPVELGGMRFSTCHYKVNSLIDHLGLPTELFSGKTKESLYYLRGVHLKSSELIDPKKLPYKLAIDEEGKSPYQILMNAVTTAIPDIEHLTYEEWLEKKESYQWQGKYLHECSWQRLLAENMSDEAFQFLVDLGYIQLTAEVSAYTQLDGFLDKSQGVYKIISTGYQSLPETLANIAKKQGVGIELETKLVRIEQNELIFEGPGGIKAVHAKSVIFAVTPPALLQFWEASPCLQTLVKKEELDVFWSNPLSKLFFAYRSPWWRELGLYDGSSTTTLPIRNCFYFGTESEAYVGEKDNHNALLLASYQGSFPSFWKTAEVIEFGQHCLKKLHGIEDIPAPYAAVFFNWDSPPHFGAYFFWKMGVKPKDWYEKHCQLGDSSFFIVGSEYSTKQGWVEGALETCDQLLEKKRQRLLHLELQS